MVKIKQIIGLLELLNDFIKSDGSVDFTAAQKGIEGTDPAHLVINSQLDGLIADYTVTEADVTQHQAALVITESQISDLNHFSGNYNDLSNQPDLSVYDNFDSFLNEADFPAVGDSEIIYLETSSGTMFRWTGTVYAIISAKLALGETANTAYRGDRGKTAYDHSQLTSGNPHGVTKAHVGLGNANNTSDADKPISTATQLALDFKLQVGDNVSTLLNDAGYISQIATLPEIGDVPVYPVGGEDAILVRKNGVNIWGNTPVPVGTLQHFEKLTEMGLAGGSIRTLVGENGFWMVVTAAYSGANNASRSFDNGLTWEAITVPARDWDGCKMQNGRIMFAAQTNGPNLIISDDFGDTWTSQSYTNLYATNIDANDQVWIVTRWNPQVVFRNTANGDVGNWTSIGVGGIPGLIIYGYDNVWMLAITNSLTYRIKRSIDNGLTWQELASLPSQNVNYIFGYYKRVWMFFDTATKKIYTSVDNGDTLVEVASQITFTGTPSRIVGGAGMWYMLFGSKWYISTDVGVSWTALSGNVPALQYGKALFSAGVVMVATTQGVSRFPVLDSPELWVDPSIDINEMSANINLILEDYIKSDLDFTTPNRIIVVDSTGRKVKQSDFLLSDFLQSVTAADVTQHQAALSITESQISDLNHFSGMYNDLTGKPSLFSGNYNDLSNQPDLSVYDNFDPYATQAEFPITGTSDIIYLETSSGTMFRWTGSVYAIISAKLALGETAQTAYRGDRGKLAYDHSQLTSGNPHGVTKTEVGLGNVDNTSDSSKPVSTATQTALNLKANNGANISGFTNNSVYLNKTALEALSLLFSKGIGNLPIQILSDVGVLRYDLTGGNKFYTTLFENTYLNPPDTDRGQAVEILIESAGAFTFTFDNKYIILGDTPPVGTGTKFLLSISCWGVSVSDPIVVVNTLIP